MSTTSISEMNSHESNLLARLRRVAKHAWLLSLAIHWAQGFLIVVAAAFLFIILDYYLRWNDKAIRLLVSSVFAAISIFVFRSWIVTGWRQRPTLSMVAKKIELAYAIPRGWLSSFVDWKTNAEITPGISPALQQRAVMEIAQACQDHRFESIVNPRRGLIWSAIACTVAVTIAGALFCQPSMMKLAILRLTNPWTHETWPRLVYLEFVGLPRIVQEGTSISVAAVNRQGEMPEDVRLWIRQGGISSSLGIDESRLPMTTWTLSPQYESFEVRLEGGDDTQQDWVSIRIAKAPQLAHHHFEITPPVYTNESPRQLTGSHIELLEGTQFRLRGKFSQPVSSLRLHSVVWPEGDSAQIADGNSIHLVPYSLSDQGPVSITDTSEDPSQSRNTRSPPMSFDSHWSIRLADDRTSFVLESQSATPIEAERSVQFGLQWESRDGLVVESTESWDIRVLRDQLPEVRLVQPDKDLKISINSEIPLLVEASDDHGLVRLLLEWQQLGNEGTVLAENEIDLLKEDPLVQRERSASELFHWHTAEVARRAGKGAWFPGSVMSLEVGQTVRCRMVARDTAHQIASSEWRSFHVDAPQELLRQLEARQVALARTLAEAMDNQRRALSHTSRLTESIDDKKTIDASDVQSLEWIAGSQESVESYLADNETSAQSIIDQTLQHMREDRLDETEDYVRWSRWKKRLAETVEPLLTRSLSSIADLELLSRDSSEIERWQGSIHQLQNDQLAIEAELVELLEELGRSSNFREHQEQIRNLAMREDQLSAKSQALMSTEASESRQALKDQLVEEQNALARQTDSIRRALAQSIQQESREGTENSTLNEMRKSLDNADLTQRMRDVNGLLQKDDFEEAALRQSQIASDLRATASLSSTLGKAEYSSDTESSSLTRWKGTLERLLQQQQAIVRDIQDWSMETSPSSEEEKEQTLKMATRIAQSQERTRKDLNRLVAEQNVEATFRWVTESCSQDMARSAAALLRLQIEPLALRHAKTAESRLNSMVKALEVRLPDPNKTSEMAADPESDSEEAENQKEEGNSVEKTIPLESLLLIRGVQESIRLRVEEIQKSVGDGKLTPEQWLEVNDLAHQQQELAAQMQRIIDSQGEKE